MQDAESTIEFMTCSAFDEGVEAVLQGLRADGFESGGTALAAVIRELGQKFSPFELAKICTYATFIVNKKF